MDNRDFRNEIEMLNGNICRICVSNDVEEINSMCDFAIKRILEIKHFRLEQLNKEDK